MTASWASSSSVSSSISCKKIASFSDANNSLKGFIIIRFALPLRHDSIGPKSGSFYDWKSDVRIIIDD